jgi:peptide/nickel transport system substrate-binding protein
MLAKLEVRQAIAHAINRDLIARLVWNGYATAARSPVSRQAGNAQAKSLPEYRYDPAAANALLDKAGYPRINGGSRFSVRLDWVPLGESNLLAAQLIKQQLAAVGINAEIRSADFATYIKQVYADYDFDLNLMLYTPTHDASIGLDRFYSSKGAVKGTPFVNAGGYASPSMDGILAAADNEPDPGKRKALLDAFQRKAMEDLPFVPILDLSYVTVRSARVHGLMDSPEGIRGNFADVWLSP